MLDTIVRPAVEEQTSFEVRKFSALAVILVDATGERLALSDGFSRVSLRLVGSSILDGPVNLNFVVAEARAAAQLQTLARFRALREGGAFGAWLQRPPVRANRWIRQLRAFDALTVGASERDIASTLFGIERIDQQWSDGSLRSTVRRLVSAARRNVAGGYRDLLKGA